MRGIVKRRGNDWAGCTRRDGCDDWRGAAEWGDLSGSGREAGGTLGRVIVTGAAREGPARTGQGRQPVLDASTQLRQERREADADASQEPHVARAIDGVGDADGSGEGEQWGAVRTQTARQVRGITAIAREQSGQADVGLEPAGAAIRTDGWIAIRFCDGDIELTEMP